MGFLADKCTFRLLTRELIATCKQFSCGYDDLDEYFLKDSPLWADQMYGKTYCFVLKDDPQTIVCAFSLSNETIRVDLLPNSQKKRFLKEIPKEKRMRRYSAVLIGRLGVDIQFANNGIGTELMQILKFWFIEPDNKAVGSRGSTDHFSQSLHHSRRCSADGSILCRFSARARFCRSFDLMFHFGITSQTSV